MASHAELLAGKLNSDPSDWWSIVLVDLNALVEGISDDWGTRSGDSIQMEDGTSIEYCPGASGGDWVANPPGPCRCAFPDTQRSAWGLCPMVGNPHDSYENHYATHLLMSESDILPDSVSMVCWDCAHYTNPWPEGWRVAPRSLDVD